MKLRKSRLSLAVGVALGAAAMIPATSFGWSVNTTTNPGTLLTASGGDTLLFPIYSTVDPMTTSFSVTNTSMTQTVAAKIRFREQDKSMDVLDFIVVLSPNDKFDFTVAQAADAERPTMSWNDNSCLVGPGTGGSVNFPPPTTFAGSNETMSVGHLEVLGMANLDAVYVLPNGSAWLPDGVTPVDATTTGAINLGDAAQHGTDGVPENCGILVTSLSSPANVQSIRAASVRNEVDLDVDNILVGRYVMTGAGLGIEAGGDAIGIRDSDFTLSAQSSALCSALTNDPNCVGYYAWDQREWDHPHLGDMANLAGFQSALTAANISGDWSNNPANFVGVDWVLSFPNKYAYLDYVPAANCDGGATTGSEWCLLYGTRSGNGTAGLWTAGGTQVVPPTELTDQILGTADLCISPAMLAVYDREEGEASGNVTVSPGSATQLGLCHELEVFTLAGAGQQVRDSVIQTADQRRIIEFENLDAIRGWAGMTVPWATVGDSISGILFTTRNTDDPTINNGSITELQKDVGM
jgi:hypothetical protein